MSAAAPPGTRPPLREIQLLVWRLLVAPEGAPKGIRDLTALGDEAVSHFDEWFAGDDRLDGAGRLDIYANMYFYRLKDALLEDFPRTARVLGEALFHNLVTDFLLVHPSSHPSLRWLGKPLPAFLESHEYGRRLPYLADLAALEWARGDVFQEVDSPTLDTAALARVPPEAWGGIRFRPIAALRLLRTAWETALLWERLGDEGESVRPEVVRRDQAVLVFRRDDAAHHEVIPGKGASAVEALLAGRSFAGICEALAGGDEVEPAAADAAKLLEQWIGHGLLSGFSLG